MQRIIERGTRWFRCDPWVTGFAAAIGLVEVSAVLAGPLMGG